jgi:hypothetical protein
MKHERRIGEAIMILSGIAISIGANGIGVIPVVYGGLAIMGLGLISVFWR